MRWILSLVPCALFAVATAGAQGVAPPPGIEGAATDPIRCWWKTDRSAVHVGERFTLTLTCSIVETADVRVLVDQSRLDPTAVQLPPFDVVDGARHEDIVAGQRRLFQYEYVMRIIAEDLFGRFVAIPAFDINYRVQSDVQGTGTVESLEQAYRLTSLPMHVTAQVSLTQSTDIRDASTGSFEVVARRRFRGNVVFGLAALLFSAGLGSLAVAAGGLVRRYRSPSAAAVKLLSDRGVVRAALGELQEVQRQTQLAGWDAAALSRALAPVRIGLAVALRRHPTQTVVADNEPAREGTLVVRTGRWRPKRLMVSATITEETLAPAFEAGGGAGDGSPDASSSVMLDDLRGALAAFTRARYGRGEAARDDLDRALADAIGHLKRLRAEYSLQNQAVETAGRLLARRRASA